MAAAAVVQHVHPTSNLGNSNDIAVTTTSTTPSNLLVAITYNKGGRGVASIAGDTFTQATNALAKRTAGTYWIDIWYRLLATGGATTITATFDGVAGTYAKGIELIEVSPATGMAWFFDLADHVDNGSADPELGPSLTPPTADSFLCGGYISNNNNTGVTVWTTVADSNTSGSDFGSWAASGLLTTSQSATAASYTDGGSGNGYCASAACFHEAAAAGQATMLRFGPSQRPGVAIGQPRKSGRGRGFASMYVPKAPAGYARRDSGLYLKAA